MKSRSPSGNMLILVILTMGIILLLGLIGFTFNGFLYRCNQSQYKVDATTLAMASSINAGDRVGQINELEECSRELLFDSRQQQDECNQQGLTGFSPLYEQLLQEARNGQRMVEQERQNLDAIIVSELQKQAQEYNRKAIAANPFGLFWLHTQEPVIQGVNVGNPHGIPSNVESLDVIPALSEFDREQNYLVLPGKLFKGNIDARLPMTENTLHFRLSSLPAYIDGTCSPARNANPNAFEKTAVIFDEGHLVPALPDQIPTAVQVVCSMDTAVGNDNNQNRTPVNLTSVGITNGAVAGGP